MRGEGKREGEAVGQGGEVAWLVGYYVDLLLFRKALRISERGDTQNKDKRPS